MFMIKSNGGSGTVKNCQFNNFIGHTNAYSLDLNAYWSSMSVVAGDGVFYEDLTFKNWKGRGEELRKERLKRHLYTCLLLLSTASTGPSVIPIVFRECN